MEEDLNNTSSPKSDEEDDGDHHNEEDYSNTQDNAINIGYIDIEYRIGNKNVFTRIHVNSLWTCNHCDCSSILTVYYIQGNRIYMITPDGRETFFYTEEFLHLFKPHAGASWCLIQ